MIARVGGTVPSVPNLRDPPTQLCASKRSPAVQVECQPRDVPRAPGKPFVTGILLPLTGRMEAVPEGAGLGKSSEKLA